MAPVLLLLVIAPLVAEFLLGDVTLASLPALVLFIPLYGGGAVLIRVWSRRPGWGDRQILALAAGPLFAYAWHAFISPPAFDSASIVIVRVSNVVFAALALAAVSIAARRISDKWE
jgi:hypothetical protein